MLCPALYLNFQVPPAGSNKACTAGADGGGVGLDPASASAPFVATLVDVSGLVIYFSVARAVLGITGG
jgi:hypothetical protein